MDFNEGIRRKFQRSREIQESTEHGDVAANNHLLELTLPSVKADHKDVIVDPDDTSKVIKLYRERSTEHDANKTRGIEPRTIENQSKVNFYLQKIVHALLPDNIPNRHTAGTSPKFTRDQRMRYRPHPQYDQLGYEHLDMLPSKVRSLVDELHKLGVFVDISSRNFGLDEQENVIYMDDLYMGMNIFEALGARINAITDEDEKRRISKLLERLRHWSYKAD